MKLGEAEKRFDVLVTMDSNMMHQQNLARFRTAVIALTFPLMPKVLAALPGIHPGTLTLVT